MTTPRNGRKAREKPTMKGAWLLALLAVVLLATLGWHATVAGVTVPVLPAALATGEAAFLAVVACGIARSLGWRLVIEWP
jgi:hypothetical protein